MRMTIEERSTICTTMPKKTLKENHSAAMQPNIPTGWEGGIILSAVLILLSIGLSTLYSASNYMALHEGVEGYSYLIRQAQGVVMGGFLALLFSQIHYARWEKAANLLLALAAISLVIVLIPGLEAIAPKINGARRWLRIGPITIQPSEFAKLAIIIWTARTLIKRQDRLNSFRRGLMPFLGVWGILVGLIAIEPSVSAALLCALLAGIVAFVGRARTGHFVALGIVATPAVWSFIMGAEYRVARLAAFIDPASDMKGIGYQVHQALTAIGSGGIFGKGFGQSVMKTGFLPEPHNDFAAAILGEEWGFVGIVTLTLLYTTIGIAGYRIARDAPDRFGSILATGLTALIVVPALIHLGINLSLLPPTGVALPFVSYGRSNLLVSFSALGILLNIAAAGCYQRDVRLSISKARGR